MRNRRYETVFMLPADLDDGKTREILERLNNALERSGGILVKREDWGVRKLAYEIKRNTKGRYFLLDFAGDPKSVAELERNIKMIESILRFLTIKKADDADMEAIQKEREAEREKEEAKKAASAAAAAPKVEPKEPESKAAPAEKTEEADAPDESSADDSNKQEDKDNETSEEPSEETSDEKKDIPGE